MLKRKLKSLAIMTILVTVVGLIGCNKSKDDKKDEAVNEKKTPKITLVLSKGGVNDESFNQGAWEGALKAKDDYGVDVAYLESKQDSDYISNIETAIDNESDLVIGVGFELGEAIEKSAKLYPDTKFAVVDSTYDEIPKNVQPILFNEEQSGYLVGLIASKMTKTKTVGFVGGMDIPSVTNFLVGFEKALKEVDKDIKVLYQNANSFTDASKGRAIAEQMVSNKADIIFTAGGGVNNGVYEVAQEKKIKAIGVDMPSSKYAPEVIITSALKNVGTGVQLTIKDLVDGTFVGGQPKYFDLSNNGVGYEKTDLIPQDVIDFVESKINNK